MWRDGLADFEAAARYLTDSCLVAISLAFLSLVSLCRAICLRKDSSANFCFSRNLRLSFM